MCDGFWHTCRRWEDCYAITLFVKGILSTRSDTWVSGTYNQGIRLDINKPLHVTDIRLSFPWFIFIIFDSPLHLQTFLFDIDIIKHLRTHSTPIAASLPPASVPMCRPSYYELLQVFQFCNRFRVWDRRALTLAKCRSLTGTVSILYSISGVSLSYRCLHNPASP